MELNVVRNRRGKCRLGRIRKYTITTVYVGKKNIRKWLAVDMRGLPDPTNFIIKIGSSGDSKLKIGRIRVRDVILIIRR
jgi:hypothetical protein